MPVHICIPGEPERVVEVSMYRLDPYNLDPAIRPGQRSLLTIHAGTFPPPSCWTYIREHELAVQVGLITEGEKRSLDYWATMDLVIERIQTKWGNDGNQCLRQLPESAVHLLEVELGRPHITF